MFERFGALMADIALKGLIAGSSLMFGAFIAKRFVPRLEPDVFRLVRDGIMRVAGLAMSWMRVECRSNLGPRKNMHRCGNRDRYAPLD
jgi:uncharacterized protein